MSSRRVDIDLDLGPSIREVRQGLAGVHTKNPRTPKPKPGRSPKRQPELEPAPAVATSVADSSIRLVMQEPAELAPTVPDPAPRAPEAPAPETSLEVALPADVVQRQMVDQFGELDRRRQLRAADDAKYETLKRAIKGWFDQAPPDSDGVVEGNVYRLHLSARERERKVRDVRQLIDLIGIDKVLEVATIPLGALENLLGKTQVAALAVETRTGSRRIKAVPKHPAQSA